MEYVGECKVLEFPTRTYAQLEADFGIVNRYKAQGNMLTTSIQLIGPADD